MKNFIDSLHDIEFLCSNMRIEDYGAIYDIKYKKCDFEIRGMGNEAKRKRVPQMRNAHTRACE